jgi:general secretion pathway protein A
MNYDNPQLIHLKTLGLGFNPFPVVPDAHNYFTTEKMHVAISDILHCIDARKGFILISGEVGLGKTTLSRLLLLKLAIKKINTSLVLNTFLQSSSLLKAINNDFNIRIESDAIEDQLDALNNFLLEQYAQNRNCVIVIDDAQQLNFKSLELIRQISNLETNKNKLVQIILVAQGEIINTLNKNKLRQLKSRIALNITMEAFTLKELQQYIDFRLARAGSSGQISLEKSAFKKLHKLTQGLPRQINLIMDRCLYVVAAFGLKRINKKLITKAHDEISFNKKSKLLMPRQIKKIAMAALLLLAVGTPFYLYKDTLFSLSSTKEHLNTVIKKENDVVNGYYNLANVKHSIAAPKQETSVALSEDRQQKLSQEETAEDLYLQKFGLSALNKFFINSIKNNDFSLFKHHLLKAYEYELLISDEEIQTNNQDEIWQFYDANNNKQWLTFWKPEITLHGFYQGYYSQAVEQLQNNLQNEGFYRSIIDGFVGEKTIIAVSKFQRSIGINASGFPNELTLYQLQKLNTRDVRTKLDEQPSKGLPRDSNDRKETKIGKPVQRYALDNSNIND